MVEKTSFLFRRSEINPNLKDVELEVELTPDELKLVEEIKSLQEGGEISQETMRGSGDIREYATRHSVPWGYGLVGPREDLLGKFQATRDFISDHMERIERQSPTCVSVIEGIQERLDQMLGQE